MKLHSIRRPIHFSIAASMLVFLLAAIGFVSSFGTTADVGGSSASSALQRNQQQQQFGLQKPRTASHPITSTALTSSLTVPDTNHAGAIKSPLFRNPLSPLSDSRPTSSLSAAAHSATVAGEIPKKRSLLRKILWNANPRSGRKDGRWKGGEFSSSLASRLFFSYVSPLLDVVADKNANRTLTEDDAFALYEKHSMNVAVESLADTYDQTRTKARRQLEEKKQASTNQRSIKNSESLILLKALVRDQKSALLLTGVLRLCNTVIQAFPSLLVARLLRSIEAGPSAPVQESLKAAFMLVGVLCLKMITENQYFHNVVRMATQVRGTVEGMIFDKSLRLPEGGSGVLTKVDSRDKNKSADGSTKKEKQKKALGSGGVSSNMNGLYNLDHHDCISIWMMF